MRRRESLPSAKQFIADYEAANYAEPFGAYGALTYDATNVIIQALAKAVQGGTWSEDTRQTVVSNVQATNIEGAGGPISFDEFGDTTNKVLTVYTVKGDNFEPDRGLDGQLPGLTSRVARTIASTPAGAGIARPRPVCNRSDHDAAAPHRTESRKGPTLLATFLSQVVNGLILGSLIGLIALGYTMVYGIIQLINFAHGEVFMVGAYGGLAMFTYLLPTFIQQQWYLALPLLLIGGAAVSTGVAVLMERFAYRPLRGAPRLAPLITALGVSVVLQELVRNFYPGATAALPFPQVFVTGTWEIPVPGGTVPLRWTGLLIIVLSLVLAAVLTTFVNNTRMGRAMRAVSQDPDTARLMGVDTDRIIVLTFVLGAALAGVAGIMYGTDLGFINIDMGFQTGIFAFTAAVLGGIGDLKGAVVGGIVIGLVKALGGQYLPGGTAYDYVWIFVVLIAVLVFRPQGFFGESERVRA